MEIERKFLIKELPKPLSAYSCRRIEQGYLSVDPVIRIRRDENDYYLTYKGSGLLAREEHNLPLTKDAYEHLIQKADGIVISKERYMIPINDRLTVELDIFAPPLHPLIIAEVEFESIEEAKDFLPLSWFKKDVTADHRYANSSLCAYGLSLFEPADF